MAYAGAGAGAHAAAMHTSSYRVKFRRQEFLDLVEMAQPEIIYHSGRIHFFAYDGFVMYSLDCKNEDFRVKIFEAIEFSNTQWRE